MESRSHSLSLPVREVLAYRVAIAATVILALWAAKPCPAQVTFSDRTIEAGLMAFHNPDDTCICAQQWMTGGMAVGDFNNDGWQDLFWVGGGEALDKLLINNGDGTGTFSDQTADWELDLLHAGNSASVGDYNNDGWVDIYVTSFGIPGQCNPSVCIPNDLDAVGQHRLYRNNGDGTFTDVAEEAGVNYGSLTHGTGYGSAFGDYDLDGDLDLFLTSWWAAAAGNRLFRNDGDGSFTDVTASALGLGIADVWGFQPAFVDMNDDLYPEILVAADFETSCYFVNNGDGTFSNTTPESGTGLDDNGMGQTVADFNGDGLFDWYVTSVHLENPEPEDNIGNMLYIAQGNDVYQEVSVLAGVNDGGWGWGTVAVDLDQDGWVDIVEVNGRPAAEWDNERAKLFHNQTGSTFDEIAQAAGLNHTGQGRAVVRLDADNDGDQDIAIATNSAALAYYRNDTDPAGNWLRVLLDTSTNPLLAPNGFGTKIVATVGDRDHVGYLNGAPSYLGTSELSVHFGLGSASSIDQLQIIWSRGYVTTMENVAVNQHLNVSAPALADLTADGVVNAQDLAILLGNWGPVSGSATLVSDLDNDGTVGAQDLAILLGSWGP